MKKQYRELMFIYLFISHVEADWLQVINHSPILPWHRLHCHSVSDEEDSGIYLKTGQDHNCKDITVLSQTICT